MPRIPVHLPKTVGQPRMSQLLSLPVETLDTVISFIVHPIDAYSLSRTCKRLQAHLKSQSNSFWHKLLRMHRLHDRPHLKLYDPERDYFGYAMAGYLFIGACHLCFGFTSLQERGWLREMGVGKEAFRALGVRVCISCFFEHTIRKFISPKDAKIEKEKCTGTG